MSTPKTQCPNCLKSFVKISAHKKCNVLPQVIIPTVVQQQQIMPQIVPEIASVMALEIAPVIVQKHAKEIAVQTDQYDCQKCLQQNKIEAPIVQLAKQLDSTNTLLLQKPKYNQLQQIDGVFDDIIVLNKSLLLQQNNTWFDASNLNIFREYDKNPSFNPDNRLCLQKQEDYYQLCSYRNYPEKQEVDYHSMNKYSIQQVYSKLVNEAQIKFRQQQLSSAFYDIETANYKNKEKVPIFTDNNSVICTIQLVHNMDVFVFTTFDYLYNLQKIQQECQGYKINIIYCHNEQTACIKFIMKCQEISKIQKTLLIGFNASQGSLSRPAYDLPFILNRARMYHKTLQSNVKYFFNLEKDIYFCDLLPNCIIKDAKQFFYEQVQLSQKKLNGYKLDNFIECLNENVTDQPLPYKKCDNTDENRYEILQEQLLNIALDQTDNLIYGIWDCIVLQLAINKKRYIEQIEQSLILTKSAPSVFIAQKQAVMVKHELMHRFYINNYKFTYDYINTQSSVSQYHKLGAFTAPCMEKDRYQVIKNVIDFDFTSFYPTTAIYSNISPDTLSREKPEISHNEIDITYQFAINNQPIVEHKKQLCPDNIVYFTTQKVGIIPQIWQEYFDQRILVKKQAKQLKEAGKDDEAEICNLKQYYLKIFINTTYGVLLQESFGLYNFYCGQAITSMCRQHLEKVILNTQQEYGANCVLFVDTDGFQVVTPEDKPPTKQNIEKLLLNINKQFITPEQPKQIMQLATKSVMDVFLTKVKKQYLMIQKTDESLNFIEPTFDFRGCAISSFKPVYKQKVLNILQDVIGGKVEYKQAISDLEQFLVNLFYKATDVQQLADYTFVIKGNKTVNKAGKMTAIGYMNQHYHKSTYYTCFYYNNCEKQLSYNVRPIEAITNVKNIDITRTINRLTQGLRTFFGTSKIEQCDDNGVDLNDDDDSDEIWVRLETVNDRNKKIKMHPDIIQQYIQENPSHVLHTILQESNCKLTFDIDGKYPLLLDKFSEAVCQIINIRPKMHVAVGHKKNEQGEVEKYSYHIVYDIVYPLNICKEIATILQKKYHCIDLAIYRNNGTLRLPLCYKMGDNGIIEKRKLTFNVNNSRLQDFLVNYFTENQIYNINDLAYSNLPPIDDCNHEFNKFDSQLLLQQLKSQFDLQCTLTGTRYNTVVPSVKPYMCPVHKRQHDSENMSYCNDRLYCYASTASGEKAYIEFPLQTLVVKQEIHQVKPLNTILRQNQPLVQYHIDRAKITYVKSQMGTGKTKCLREQLEFYTSVNPNLRVLAISFRRTFANDFSTKFNMVNYQTLVANKQQISMLTSPQICVQVDSLYKMDLQQCLPDILIVDEIESILSQLHGFKHKGSAQANRLSLLQLITQTPRVVVLDATLQQSTINMVNQLCQITSQQIIHNDYKIKSEYKQEIVLVNSSKSHKQHYIELLMAKLQDNKKIVACISSEKMAEHCYNEAVKLKKIVILYTGSDLKFYNGKVMKDIKEEHFKDVGEHWQNCDLLIYTSTLTAGVSFEGIHFDCSYNFLHSHTANVQLFIQSIHRVRNLNDKNMVTYVQPQAFFGAISTYELTSKYTQIVDKLQNLDQISSLNCWLQVRDNCIMMFRKQLLLTWIDDMGYQITITDLQKSNVKNSAELHIPLKIDYVDNLTEIEFNTIINNSEKESWLASNLDENTYGKVCTAKLMKLYNYTYQQYQQLVSTYGQHVDKIMECMSKQQNINSIRAKHFVDKVTEQFQLGNISDGKEFIEDYIKQYSKTSNEVVSQFNTVVNNNVDFYINLLIAVQLQQKVQSIFKMKPEEFQEGETIKTLLSKLAGTSNKFTSSINHKLAPLNYEIKSKKSHNKTSYEFKEKPPISWFYCTISVNETQNIFVIKTPQDTKFTINM